MSDDPIDIDTAVEPLLAQNSDSPRAPFGGAIVGAVIGTISVLIVYFNFIDDGWGMSLSQQQGIGVAMAIVGAIGALIGGYTVQLIWRSLFD